MAQRRARDQRTSSSARLDPAPRRGLRGAARDPAASGSSACSISAPATATRSRSCSPPVRARPASGSTSRPRCSTGPASASPADRRVEIRRARSRRAAARRLGDFDVVVSSFAIHHLAPERQTRALRRGVRAPRGRAGCSSTSSTSPRRRRRATRSSSTRSAAAPSTTIRRTSWSRSRRIWAGWTAADSPTPTVFGSGGNLPLLRVRSLGNADPEGPAMSTARLLRLPRVERRDPRPRARARRRLGRPPARSSPCSRPAALSGIPNAVAESVPAVQRDGIQAGRGPTRRS